MISRGPLRTASVLALGLLAATLYVGTAPGATADSSTSADTPACTVSAPALEQGTQVDTPVTDGVYDGADSGGVASCAARLAGSLCLSVWQTTMPLVRTRVPGVGLLCSSMTVAARWNAAVQSSAGVALVG